MPQSRSYPPVASRRDCEVKVRLAPAEMEALRQRAALARQAPASYARLVLLGELGDRLEPVKERQAA